MQLKRKFFASSIILTLFAIILLALEFHLPNFFYWWFDRSFDMIQLPELIYFISFTAVCFFILPVIYSRIFFQEKVSNLGIKLPQNKREACFLILIALCLLIPTMMILAKQEAFQKYYALTDLHFNKLIFTQLIIFPIYYFFEEFFFRGFLLVNLWSKVRWHSFWITDILFTLAHINKPLMEIVIAVPAGIIFAFLAWRTRSIYPSMIVHYAMGVTVIVTVNHVI
jgi:membrane protease YdiL (CAAX protease family)